ncbi:putative F-box domain-containing protein [Heracleum sosnowskyi]|uniref:F-box domain-containing protein n=1 Tax=Heracleum sosnowskyi TaxID=360622 RepID=A0AAD8NCZ5_9APIA|nr:putative F-box domain-containing protein [Heracleum sosnowskyi]
MNGAAGDNGGDENQQHPHREINVPPLRMKRSRKRRQEHRRLFATHSGTLSCDEDADKNELSGMDLDFFYDLSHFPDSVLLEVLIRLPVRSMFRYKCVCKQWLSLISHPSCSRFYVSMRLNASLPFRLFYRYVYVPEFKEVLRRLRPDVYVSKEFSVLFLSSLEEQQQSDQFKVLAVSNGLVMFCLLGPLVYYVCDPVTRQWVSLPRGRQNALIRHPVFYGEGLVSRVNEDNVVTSYRAVRVECILGDSFFLNLETFSSETGVWTAHTLGCPKKIRLLRRGVGPINFNGILHWFVRDNGMVAFDPYENSNRCRLIQFPDGRNDSENEEQHDSLYRLCNVSQGKLRYFTVAPEPSEVICFSMWTLENYEKGEWLMEFEVTRSDLCSEDDSLSNLLPTATFFPLSFHPFDANVVYMRCAERSCIVTYNVRARRLDVICEANGVVEDLSWRVVVPVVLPMWPTPLPRPAKKSLKRPLICGK